MRIPVMLAFMALLVLSLPLDGINDAAGQPSGEDPQGRSGSDYAISLEALLRVVSANRGDPIAESLVVGLIRLYGVSFHLRNEDLASLKSAGASQPLLSEVAKAKVHIPEPPPRREGVLSVSCLPVDCDVEVNGRAVGTTSGGELRHTIPVGDVRVHVVKEDYTVDREEQVISITPTTTSRVHFRLTLARQVLESNGERQFKRMLSALGDDYLSGGSSYQRRSKGLIRIRERNHAPKIWSLTSTVDARDRASFVLNQGRQKYTLTFDGKGQGLKWKPRPKRDEDKAIEDAVRLLFDFELRGLIARVVEKHMPLTAHSTEAEQLDRNRFWARDEGRAYLVTLDGSSRPVEIRFESPGLDNGTRILFTQYAETQGSWFPTKMEIIRPSGQDGIEVEFDSVELAPRSKPRKS